MRKAILCFIVITALKLNSAGASSGPQTAWSVFVLPNPVITPNWRSFAPANCASNPDACAGDNRFWESWNFSAFASDIDASFKAVKQQGKYHAVMILMPLGDTPTFWNNIQLVYRSAAIQGVALQVVLFPKWNYGAEWCDLYSANAPASCPRAASMPRRARVSRADRPKSGARSKRHSRRRHQTSFQAAGSWFRFSSPTDSGSTS